MYRETQNKGANRPDDVFKAAGSIIAMHWSKLSVKITNVIAIVMAVVASIVKLGRLDLSEDRSIVKYAGTKSEVGQIATAVQDLTEKLSSIINTLGTCSDSLSNSTVIMNDTFQELRGNIENNAATTEELSASITNTNEAIDKMSTEMNKMGDMIDNIAEENSSNAKEINDIIERFNC